MRTLVDSEVVQKSALLMVAQTGLIDELSTRGIEERLKVSGGSSCSSLPLRSILELGLIDDGEVSRPRFGPDKNPSQSCVDEGDRNGVL
ncbi:unnamed protein product [Brassica oleracea var. botrytis]